MKTKLLVQMMGLTVAPLVITACSTHTPKWQEENKEYHKSTQEYKDAKSQMRPNEVRYVEFNSGYYVDKTPIQIIKDKKNLPSVFYKDLEMFAPTPVSLTDFAAEVFQKSNVSIKFIDNRQQPNTKGNSNSNNRNNSAATANNYVPPPFPEVATGVATNQITTSIVEVDKSQAETENDIILDYKGELRGLLDFVAVKKNLKWRYDVTTNKVFFYPLETETMTVFAVAEDINLKSTVTTNTSSSNSSSSNDSSSDATSKNEQEITFDQEQKYWEDVTKTVESMLSSEGRVSFNKTQGKVTVTDNDYTLSQIKNYIENLNSDAYKQVTIDFKIINLKLDDARDLGVNMNFINDRLNFNFGNGAITADNAFGSIAWTKGNDKVLLNVLDKLGTVKVDTNISVVTANNMPVPVQVTQNQAYIKERRIESGSTDSDPIEEVTTDTVSQGVTATITPKAMGQNVLLNYSMNLSVIDSLETAPGDTKIQLPITSTKNFVQRLTIRNGEPKVIAAFEKTDSKTGSKHPLNPSLWFIGGQETFSKEKEIILLIATPYISTLSQ
jgi:type IVB pilus formation R64 PilN family outer membrane protein